MHLVKAASNYQRTHTVRSMRELLAIRDSPDKWLVKNMIPNTGKVIVYGKSNHYKTTIILDLCVAMSSDQLFMNGIKVNKYGPVLIISTEGSIYDTRDRLAAHARAHGINPAILPLFHCQEPFMLDDISDFRELESYIAEIKPIMVVLDPLRSFFAGEENSATEVTKLQRNIDKLTTKYETAFVIIHHQGKHSETPRGSSSWVGWADTVLHVTANKLKLGLPEDLEVVEVKSTKQRNGRKGKILSAVPNIDNKLDQITFTFYDEGDTQVIKDSYWRSKCYRVLCEADSPLLAKEIVAALNGVKKATVSKALTSLAEIGLIAQDQYVTRPCGTGGANTRSVKAWRALGRRTLTDNAIIMIRAEADLVDSIEDAYKVRDELIEDIIDQQELQDANQTKQTRVHQEGIGSGQGFQPVLCQPNSSPKTQA